MRLTFVDITEGTRPEFLPVAFDVLIICGTLKPGRSHRRRVHIPRTELRQMDQTLEVSQVLDGFVDGACGQREEPKHRCRRAHTVGRREIISSWAASGGATRDCSYINLLG